MEHNPIGSTMSDVEPIVVWGGGAIGGTIAAYWARAGIPVLLVDIIAEHVNACRTTGLRIEGSIDNFSQVIHAVTPDQLHGSIYRRIVLAVRAQATDTHTHTYIHINMTADIHTYVRTYIHSYVVT